MKKMKKILALVVAMIMVVTTMNLSGVFASDTDLQPDTTIAITNLDDGDTVNLYQVLKWTEGVGWELTDAFAGFTTNTNINKIIANEKGVELTKEDLDDIATYAKAHATSTPPALISSTKLSGTTTFTTTVDPGMYLALVAPAVSGVVYNPIVVSADYSQTNATNEIDASTAMMGSSAVAKKKKTDVKKEETKITNDIGDTYNFVITTTVPVYSDSFVNTYFNVTDEMSQYLDYVADSIKINGQTLADFRLAATAGTITFNPVEHGFTLSFDDAYIKALNAAQELTITYQGKLNITKAEAAKLPNAQVERNDVTITFPNNPNDDTDKTVLRDGTREYTFSIDGTLLGHGSWQNSELVKVGKDKDGHILVSEISHSNGETHAALDGAKFGLYTSENAAKNDTASGLYKNDVFDGYVTTANGGLFEIRGLDVGTYYLKEISAPKGYIKDQDVHTIKIEVTSWKDVDVTEYYTISGNTVTWSDTQVTGSTPYTYTVKEVEEYKITIDGNEVSYSMDLQGPITSKSTILGSDSEIANTKGVELPSTGGMGTTLFYVIGAILVLGAGVILVTRRRMNAN